MKDKDIFEKARMNSVIIPIAGFVAAAAVVLLVIFTAAYFGAFNSMKEAVETKAPEFDVPAEPEVTFDVPVIDMHPSVYLKLSIVEFRSSNGTVSFSVRLKNDYEETAFVRSVRCILYKDNNNVGSYDIGGGFELKGKSNVVLSGKEKLAGADCVLFYVHWTDAEGREASTYIRGSGR